MDFYSYFQSYENYFWVWDTEIDEFSEGNFNLLKIPSVGTIAYTEYALGILDTLETYGYPPFGSFLLVLYAASVDDFVNFEVLRELLEKISEQSAEYEQYKIDIDKIINLLNVVKKLGSHFKKGQNKILLFQTLFKEAHNRLSTENSAQFSIRINQKDYNFKYATPKTFNLKIFHRDLHTLEIISNLFPTPQSIIQEMYGIPEITDDFEEIEDVECNEGTNFIEELIENSETFPIGNLIPRIWSGLRIPMHQSSPGEHPIGGISDIANKGNFNQILLSEFAYDNDTFVSRISNNEALYIQREIPPEKNIFERIILLDASLYNWGSPKIISFALSLAVAKHAKANANCRIFVIGNMVQEIKFRNPDDIIFAQNIIGMQLSSADILNDFINDNSFEQNTELFLITSEESFEDLDLKKSVNANRDRIRYLGTVSHTGTINLFKHTLGGRKHIGKMTLPLEELWQRKSRKKVARSPKNESTTTNYPLLFPIKSEWLESFLIDGKLYYLTRKKALLQSSLPDIRNNYNIATGKILFENISIKNKGKFELGISSEGDYILYQLLPNNKKIYELNLTQQTFREGYLGDEHCSAPVLFYDEDVLYIMDERSEIQFSTKVVDNKLVFTKTAFDKEKYRDFRERYQVKIAYKSHSPSIMSNFNQIFINRQNKIQIGKYNIVKNQYYSFDLQVSKSATILCNTERKGNTFVFGDGSKITGDARGMLIFESSNDEIPIFYMPTSIFWSSAMATTTEYTGNPEFVSFDYDLEYCTKDDFNERILQPFIQNIIDYEAYI